MCICVCTRPHANSGKAKKTRELTIICKYPYM